MTVGKKVGKPETKLKMSSRMQVTMSKMSSTWTIFSPRKSEQKMERRKQPKNQQENSPELKDSLYIERTHQVPSTMDENTSLPGHIFMKDQGKKEILKMLKERRNQPTKALSQTSSSHPSNTGF